MTADDELRAHIAAHVYQPFIEPVLLRIAKVVVRWFI